MQQLTYESKIETSEINRELVLRLYMVSKEPHRFVEAFHGWDVHVSVRLEAVNKLRRHLSKFTRMDICHLCLDCGHYPVIRGDAIIHGCLKGRADLIELRGRKYCWSCFSEVLLSPIPEETHRILRNRYDIGDAIKKREDFVQPAMIDLHSHLTTSVGSSSSHHTDIHEFEEFKEMVEMFDNTSQID